MASPPGSGGLGGSIWAGGGGVETIARGAIGCSRAVRFLARTGAADRVLPVEHAIQSTERATSQTVFFTQRTLAVAGCGGK